jgi:putative membrane protein
VTETVSPTRRPQWVYREGEEPDYRFSLANERTFLAWLRTAVAILAAALALDLLTDDGARPAWGALAKVLSVLGFLAAATAWPRWAAVERAMRRARPLPSFGSSLVLAAGLAVVCGVLGFLI